MHIKKKTSHPIKKTSKYYGVLGGTHKKYAYYEVRFDLTDTLFCLTKYELVRTTKFTRLVLPILYVKRWSGELIF